MQPKTYHPVWREQFAVRSFDIGLNWKMRISSVCSYFQEVAGRHATHLDVGYKFVQESGMVWVLSRLFISIRRLPEWGQEFILETWPMGTERVFFRREYSMHDGSHDFLKATSYWLLLDLKSRRPRIIPLNEDVIRANAGNYSMPMPAEEFPAVASSAAEVHRVRYSDLDQNRHVNNARYVEWIFDQLDQQVLETTTPSFFAIEYKQEVKAGDSVLLLKDKIQEDPLTFAVEGRLSGTGQVCVRSKITLK